jgi:hypothetical protein
VFWLCLLQEAFPFWDADLPTYIRATSYWVIQIDII